MRILFGIFGFLFLGLGTIGIILPIMPTTPFFMLSVFCFAKSSKRLNQWFLSTNLYKKHIDSFINEKSMTWKTKLSVITSVTILMSICFIIMINVPLARTFIAIVWICHILFFLFRVHTIE